MMETFLGTPQLPSREQVAGLDLDCCFQIHEPPQVGLGSQAPPTPILAPLGGLAGKWLRYTCQLQNWVTDTSLTKSVGGIASAYTKRSSLLIDCILLIEEQTF